MIPSDIHFDANATPPQWTDNGEQVIEKGTNIRIKIKGLRSEVDKMYAVGTMKEVSRIRLWRMMALLAHYELGLPWTAASIIAWAHEVQQRQTEYEKSHKKAITMLRGIDRRAVHEQKDCTRPGLRLNFGNLDIIGTYWCDLLLQLWARHGTRTKPAVHSIHVKMVRISVKA